MLTKCTTNLKFLSSVMKLQQSNSTQRLKPALHLCTGELNVRSAGHSKWQNIRHTKAAKDRARSILFARLIRDLEKAASKGSTDPKLNSELFKAIQVAQGSNMPAATISRALARVEFRKKNPVAKVLTYKGPRGIYLVLTTITDDLKKTKSDLGRIFKDRKFVSFLGDPSAAFTSKGWIFAKPPENITNVADQCLEDAIEVGAEDVHQDEEHPGLLKFTCECSELRKVKSKLESRNYVVEEAYDMYIPRMPVELPESDLKNISTMIEEVEELPEVEKVFINVV